MARDQFGNLPVPGPGFSVVRDTPHLTSKQQFETWAAVKKELRKRIRGLRRTIKRYVHSVDVQHAMRLIRKLERGEDSNDYPTSLACPNYTAHYRNRLIGALWLLCESSWALSGLTTFTVIPRTWVFTPEQLLHVDARALLKAFRTDLYSKGAAEAAGWLIVYLHGEYDPEAGLFRLHLHGLCSLEMVSVLDRLREVPRYQTRQREADGPWSAVRVPVRIRRKPLTNLPAPLSYLLQQFWPSRPIYMSDDGQPRRVRQKRRIPEPYHSLALLWLDRHGDDLCLRVHLRACRGGLVPTRCATRDS